MGTGNKSHKESQEVIEKAMNNITQLGKQLYSYLAPGTTLDITWPEIPDIVVPGQPPKLRRLIITRPHLHLSVSPKL